MKRTQVYFDPQDLQMIKALSIQKGIKPAEMTRLVIKEGLRAIDKKKSKKAGVVASLERISKLGAKGPKDLSENMNEYLYGKKSGFK